MNKVLGDFAINPARLWFHDLLMSDVAVNPASAALPPEPHYTWGPRAYSQGEVLADMIVHIIGIVFAVVGSGILLAFAITWTHGAAIAATVPYCIGLIAMIACSMAYNMTPPSARREFLRRFDHAAIFLMIAGSYTPFTTLYLSGAWAISITIVVWVIAVAGVTLKLFFPSRFEKLSLAVYLMMGWIVVVPLEQLWGTMGGASMLLLGIGGALYTAGTAFHVWHGLKFQNAIWHIFVIAAAGCHYAAVTMSVLNAPA